MLIVVKCSYKNEPTNNAAQVITSVQLVIWQPSVIICEEVIQRHLFFVFYNYRLFNIRLQLYYVVEPVNSGGDL